MGKFQPNVSQCVSFGEGDSSRESFFIDGNCLTGEQCGPLSSCFISNRTEEITSTNCVYFTQTFKFSFHREKSRAYN